MLSSNIYASIGSWEDHHRLNLLMPFCVRGCFNITSAKQPSVMQYSKWVFVSLCHKGEKCLKCQKNKRCGVCLGTFVLGALLSYLQALPGDNKVLFRAPSRVLKLLFSRDLFFSFLNISHATHLGRDFLKDQKIWFNI